MSPVTSSPLRANNSISLPTPGTDPMICRPHARGEERQLVPGQQIAAEAEGKEDPQSTTPVSQVASRGRR